MRAKVDCSWANNWHAKSDRNPTAVTNHFIFSDHSGPRQIGNVSEERCSSLNIEFVIESLFGPVSGADASRLFPATFAAAQLRDEAKKQLGAKFDLKAFDDEWSREVLVEGISRQRADAHARASHSPGAAQARESSP